MALNSHLFAFLIVFSLLFQPISPPLPPELFQPISPPLLPKTFTNVDFLSSFSVVSLHTKTTLADHRRAYYNKFGCLAKYYLFSRYKVIPFSDLMVKSITIFAPHDDDLYSRLRNFSEYSSIFSRHIVPRKLSWEDLVSLEEGAELPTFIKGFSLKISKSDKDIMLNGVPVDYWESYSGKRVVIHGIKKLLELKDEQELKGERTQIQLVAIVFGIVEMLLISILAGLFTYKQQHPESLLLVEKLREQQFNWISWFLELSSFLIEKWGEKEIHILTLFLASASLYFAWVKICYYPDSNSRVYKIVDGLLLMMTTEWTVFARVCDLLGYEIPHQVEIAAFALLSVSLTFHTFGLCRDVMRSWVLKIYASWFLSLRKRLLLRMMQRTR